MMEENNITMNMNSDNCIITNKSCIEKKSISTEEEQDKKDLQFLYQITNQNFSSPQFKKDLTAFLENGKMINLNFISNIGEQFNKNNTPSYLLYKSKVVSFEAVGAKILSEHEDIAKVRIKFANGCIADVSTSRVTIDKYRKIRIFQKDSYISVDYAGKS